MHLAGIIEEGKDQTFEKVHVEGTRHLIHEAIQRGVKRVVFQSALGADNASPYAYLRTKGEAEEIVRTSGLPYTILRPSLIIGDGDGFTERMKQLIAAGPVVPVPGDGNAKFQPLYIGDWVTCFMHILKEDLFGTMTYEIGGPEHLTFNKILGQLMSALGTEKRIVHIPTGAVRMSLPFIGIISSAAGLVGKKIPQLTNELLSLLTIDNICETDSIEKYFGFKPTPFAASLKKFLSKGIHPVTDTRHSS